MPDDPMRLSRRYVTRLSAALSLIVLTSLALILPVPYVTLRPGPAIDTLGEFQDKPVLEFGPGVKTYPTTGTLDFTTVSVTRPDSRISLLDAIKSYLDSDVAVVPRSLVYPEGTTAESSKAESAAQLTGSKDSSRVAALRAAGYDVPGVPVVAGVTADGPSDGLLEKDDKILEIDGAKVATSESVVAAVGRSKPGQVVRVRLKRGNRTEVASITTSADPETPTVPRIGVALGTSFDYPVKITNTVGSSIGGPSAGTMFALAIYDNLTPGSLTGGLEVAGTGEITPEGVVGPIGGIQQKIAGADDQGARVFLVPAANCAEALDGDTHGLKLVKITELTDAIDSLEALAEDPRATVPSCS